MTDERIPVMMLSDPPTQPTGFARVIRELAMRLPQDQFRLAMLGYGWIGTTKMPGIQGYVAHGPATFCQDALPVALMDFAPEGKVILWTLMDPWQTGWISHWKTNAMATPRTRAFFQAHRDRIIWVGHFPVDGEGARNGPPKYYEDFFDKMDVPVFMAEWGRKITQPHMKKPGHMIPHAVDTTIFKPGDRMEARMNVASVWHNLMVQVLVANEGMSVDTPRDRDLIRAALDARRFRLDPDTFLVLAVMANRSRKFWPEVLQAFRGLVDRVPNARLIGVCGNRRGNAADQWPLEEYIHDLGLRLDTKDKDPQVWLIDTVGETVWDADQALALLNRAANASVLLSGGEGTGLPQLEAHACGIPCFVGDYSASKDLIVDPREAISARAFYYVGNNMIKRPVYHARDLGDKLIYAARNPSWCRDVGAKGVDQARQRSWEVILPQWIDLFKGAWRDGTAVDSEAPTD